jgi:hypothetical protein
MDTKSLIKTIRDLYDNIVEDVPEDSWTSQMVSAVADAEEALLEAERSTISNKQYTNLVGNPINGFMCIGLFNSAQEASDWQDGCDESCWVIEFSKED